MICPKCGANLPDTAKFCPKCGGPLPITKLPAKKQTKTVVKSADKPKVNQQPIEPVVKPSKKKSGAGLVICIILCILAIVAAIISTVFLIKSQQELNDSKVQLSKVQASLDDLLNSTTEEKTTEKTTEEPTTKEQTTDAPTQDSTEESTEEVTEEATEDSTEESTEKATEGDGENSEIPQTLLDMLNNPANVINCDIGTTKDFPGYTLNVPDDWNIENDNHGYYYIDSPELLVTVTISNVTSSSIVKIPVDGGQPIPVTADEIFIKHLEDLFDSGISSDAIGRLQGNYESGYWVKLEYEYDGVTNYGYYFNIINTAKEKQCDIFINTTENISEITPLINTAIKFVSSINLK